MSNSSKDCTLCAAVPGYGTFLTCCWRDADHFPAERRAGWYALGAAAIVGILTYLAYWGFLVDLPGFGQRVAPHLPHLVIAVAAIAGAVWHLKAIQRTLGDMASMMVGMTFGMIAGFLAGYLVGATNGMFTGAVFGVIVGCSLGWYVGDCCGMFSRMEGIMAGLMAGVMGAMTAVMLLNDRLTWFTPFLLLVSLIILSGLSYLVHKEYREKQGLEVVFTGHSGFLSFTVACFLVTAVTVGMMTFGPKSVLFLGF